MKDVSYAVIAKEAAWVLSIVPPSDAYAFAQKFLSETSTAGRPGTSNPPVFVDCNAVNPASVKRISSLFSSPLSFIDATIIGGPPSDGYDPTFYACAADQVLLDKFVGLSEYGLKVSALKGEAAGIGAASALKMSYAGITKGTTGLFTTMILAAHAASPATAEALLHELQASQPGLLQRITRTIPPMLPKAYRFVGEMEEIGDFVKDGLGEGESDVHRGLAQVYARVERSMADPVLGDVGILKRFVEKAIEENK